MALGIVDRGSGPEFCFMPGLNGLGRLTMAKTWNMRSTVSTDMINTAYLVYLFEAKTTEECREVAEMFAEIIHHS